ncbi:MAG: hypothetical protein ABIJ65_07965 [Chloroflexota bacterium]
MTFQISKDWTVREIQDACQHAISVFIYLNTDCVGCRLERFCTLEEVSRSYEISIETILASFQNFVPSSSLKE